MSLERFIEHPQLQVYEQRPTIPVGSYISSSLDSFQQQQSEAWARERESAHAEYKKIFPELDSLIPKLKDAIDKATIANETKRYLLERELINAATDVLREARALRTTLGSEYIPDTNEGYRLCTALKCVINILDNPTKVSHQNVAELHGHAVQARGNANSCARFWGTFLAVAGIFLGGLGLALGLAGAVPTLGASIGIGAAGGALLVTGIGLFAGLGIQRKLSKALDKCADVSEECLNRNIRDERRKEREEQARVR